jgi:hypothetical protein
MPLLDTLKYQDSIVGANETLIATQNHSIQVNRILADSLDKAILQKEEALSHSISDEICSFLLSLKKLMIPEDTVVFVIGCSIMGVIVITADWLTYRANNGKQKSLFSLKYTDWKKILSNYLLWGMGSAVLAYTSFALGMFQCSYLACATIAITWPALLPRIIKQLNKEKAEEADEFKQPI